MANNCHIGLTSWYWIGVFISESQLSLQNKTRREEDSKYEPEDEVDFVRKMKVRGNENWRFLQLWGILCHREMAADAPAITRYHPRYHLRRRYHLKYPRCAAPLKLNYPPIQEKGKKTWRRKSGCWSRWGQNWESVSSWNLSVPQICHSFKFVPPWPVVDWCRLSIKRISTPTVSIIIDTGLASPQIKILGTSNQNYLASCNNGSCGLSITFCWKI